MLEDLKKASDDIEFTCDSLRHMLEVAQKLSQKINLVIAACEARKGVESEN